MNHFFSIVDQPIRTADDTLARLLCGFEDDSDRASTPDGQPQGSICSVFRSKSLKQHGVECMTAAHPVVHVLGLDRDGTAVLQADDTFERVTVRAGTDRGLSELMLLAVYSRLTYFRTVFVHGALVDLPGVGGLLFVGRSGVGKTTQARLWAQYRGAEIINGDKVFLSLRPECPGELMAYGSPWTGNSPYRVNKRVSLRAIVSLTRAESDGIRHLSDAEALVTYMPAVYLPGWDMRLTERVMNTLDAMMPLVPIFEMSCHINEAAVDMVANTALGRKGAAESV